jgi:hypothetical protein
VCPSYFGRAWCLRCTLRLLAAIATLLARNRAIDGVAALGREWLATDDARLLGNGTVLTLLLEFLACIGVVDADAALVAADEIAEVVAVPVDMHRTPATVAWLRWRPVLDHDHDPAIIHFELRFADGTLRTGIP